MATQNIAKLQDNTGKVIYPVTHMNAVVGIHDELDKLKQSGNVSPMVEITYDEIVALRDAGELVPGMMYRITDYTCTTTQEDTQSAHNDFDIIVTAVDVDKVSETARAIRRAGDTYFENSNLEAWQIWYTLDNDITKYGWADPENGKGVVYRMIDEFNNDCPYDFKSIQFKLYECSISYSGQHICKNINARFRNISVSLYQEICDTVAITDSEGSGWLYTFTSSHDASDSSIFGNNHHNIINSFLHSTVQYLPFIVLIDSDSYNIFTNNSQYLICYLLSCNQFNAVVGCMIDGPFVQNTLENVTYAIIDSHVSANKLYNIAGILLCNSCTANIINIGDHIALGPDNDQNNITSSTHIKFGLYCSKNELGAGCSHITLGLYCTKNIFGPHCIYNELKSLSHNNIFGNNACYNSFNDTANNSTYSENMVDPGVFGINLKTKDGSSNIQNVHILRGTGSNMDVQKAGTNGKYIYTNTDERIDIIIDTANQNYEICVGMTSDGEIRTWASTPV